ncbi:lysis system i-spanin subunit Rz [Luteimonas sp. RIT-PG2_3]
MIRILLGVVAVLLFGLSVQSCRLQESRADQAASDLKQAQDALEFTNRTLEQERAKSAALAQVAQQYEQDKADAQKRADRVVADLRAGNERLHQRWQAAIATSELSAASAASGQLDAAAEDRAESAGAIVRAAIEADAQIRGLQAVVREYVK